MQSPTTGTEPVLGHGKRVVIFEDSRAMLREYKKQFAETKATVIYFSRPHLDVSELREIQQFKPHLFVVDLLLGERETDGLRVMRTLQKDEHLREVPIVVVSKYINESPIGLEEKELVEGLHGVKAAFGKVPDLPPVSQLLLYAKQD